MTNLMAGISPLAAFDLHIAQEDRWLGPTIIELLFTDKKTKALKVDMICFG